MIEAIENCVISLDGYVKMFALPNWIFRGKTGKVRGTSLTLSSVYEEL